ncbi:hypothetical protein BGZ74_008847 [Mortierella antarctica]|nr:hypothetical protein BGZ74_008847 [Mortierella antarctica]
MVKSDMHAAWGWGIIFSIFTHLLLVTTPIDQRQRLPNECLLLVIQAFVSDLKTLRKLLLVNCFFLNAAVPLMLDDPLQAWDMLGTNPEVPSAEKMMGLSLPRRKDSDKDEDDDGDDEDEDEDLQDDD